MTTETITVETTTTMATVERIDSHLTIARRAGVANRPFSAQPGMQILVHQRARRMKNSTVAQQHLGIWSV